MKVKIENGSVTIGRHDLRDKITKCKDGYYRIKIDGWKESRSLDQNSLFWVWMEIMGEYHGMTKYEMHDEMIEMFAPIYTRKTISGKPKQERMGTSKMNMKQMSEFMNHIDRFAAEWDVQLPQPENE